MMKIQPLADRIMIKMVEKEETTASGLVLPESAQEKPEVAEVVAVGPGGVVDGQDVVMELEVGDHVLISQYGGTKVTIDEEEYTILRQDEVLALVTYE